MAIWDPVNGSELKVKIKIGNPLATSSLAEKE